jgi:hypothetical protein
MAERITADKLIAALREFNKQNGKPDADEKSIERHIQKRAAGGAFSLEEYIEGMVFAMLSSSRPWGPVENNKEKISYAPFRRM